ncbi:shikimate dehydrogenase family protein [Aerococcus urinaeequi]|uniref:shikimate dehydrogenase family protein n=1 Tax=Aerococcus urinaeequi TaxID=51665 RepID=UPI003D6B3C85
MDSITDINGTTKFAAVIGQPLNHSLSPIIYNTSFKAQDLNMVYIAFETGEDDTIERIEHLKALDVQGINITMPGKFNAMQTVDRLDAAGQYVNAINMITRDDNGQWVGYNTDGAGLWLAVKNRGVDLVGKRLVVYGSGATTRVIIVQAIIEGMTDISVVARNIQEKDLLIKLCDALRADHPQINLKLIDLSDQDHVGQAVKNAEIVIQSTSLGMGSSQGQSILADENWLQEGTVVMDVIYEPMETRFMQQAKARNCVVIGGLDMLVYQAKLNYQLFAHKEMPVQVVFDTIKGQLAARKAK